MAFLPQAALVLSSLTALWAAVANGVAVAERADQATPFLKFAPGTSGFDGVSISFDSPCAGCADDVLKLSLDIDRTGEECGFFGVRVNGVDLSQTILPSIYSSTGHGGQFDFGAVVSSNRTSGDQYLARWEQTCLGEEASLLSVEFLHGTDDGQFSVGGFSASFHQTQHPWILKLDPTAASLDINDINHDAWAHPAPEESLRIGLPPEAFSSASGQQVPVPSFPLLDDLNLPDGMRERMDRLWKLKAEKQKLNSEISDVVNDMVSIWKAEFSGCGSFTCYVQTALRSISLMCRLIFHGLSHDASAPPASGKTEAHVSLDKEAGQLEPGATMDASSALITPGPKISSDVPLSTAPPRITLSSRSVLAPPSHTGIPSPLKDAIPSPSPTEPSQPAQTQPSWARPPAVENTETAPAASPPSSSRSGDKESLGIYIKAASVSFIIVAVFGFGLFTCIKLRSCLFRNPRLRVECMARREEWKRRKAYRKAACKLRVRTFFAGIVWRRRSKEEAERTSNAEKEEWLRNKTSNVNISKARNEGSAFGPEIDGLRLASEIVGELVVRREDSRGRNSTPLARESDTTSERAASIPETLPTYSEPPGYSSAGDGEISVIDGFTGYTPSRTDESVESSVLGCSPRMSFDTQSISTTGFLADSNYQPGDSYY